MQFRTKSATSAHQYTRSTSLQSPEVINSQMKFKQRQSMYSKRWECYVLRNITIITNNVFLCLFNEKKCSDEWFVYLYHQYLLASSDRSLADTKCKLLWLPDNNFKRCMAVHMLEQILYQSCLVFVAYHIQLIVWIFSVKHKVEDPLDSLWYLGCRLPFPCAYYCWTHEINI